MITTFECPEKVCTGSSGTKDDKSIKPNSSGVYVDSAKKDIL